MDEREEMDRFGRDDRTSSALIRRAVVGLDQKEPCPLQEEPPAPAAARRCLLGERVTQRHAEMCQKQKNNNVEDERIQL